MQQDEIKLRIERSAEQNKQRIKKMQTVNQMVESLQNEARAKLHDMVVNDKAKYKDLLRKSILQSLIKLMEVNVTLRCRKSDLGLVKDVLEDAIQQYRKMMSTEVKAFEGKDVPCKVKIDEKNFLPEYSEEAGVESCMGGVVLHARKGKIVCSNTLDERMQLCY